MISSVLPLPGTQPVAEVVAEEAQPLHTEGVDSVSCNDDKTGLLGAFRLCTHAARIALEHLNVVHEQIGLYTRGSMA